MRRLIGRGVSVGMDDGKWSKRDWVLYVLLLHRPGEEIWVNVMLMVLLILGITYGVLRAIKG
jgi:hypothetical protein